MPAPERLRGLRVVADPAALDAARWAGATRVLRLAPDEAFGIGAARVEVDDEHAIVTEEAGFVAIETDRATVVGHTEWGLPASSGTSQGSIAGVPAKLELRADGTATIVTHAAYADDLLARLR